MININKGSLFLLMALVFCYKGFTQETGETLFNGYCMACHTIGKGKLVGPDLLGINNKHDQEWIIKFIKSSQSMIAEGDEKAIKIFNEFMIPMPDQALNDRQIVLMLDYIKGQSQQEDLFFTTGVEDNMEVIEENRANTKYAINVNSFGLMEITLFSLIGIKSLLLLTLIILINTINKYLKRIG
jgi:cytochrome c551/c552